MAVKDRGGSRFDVELSGRHVKRVHDRESADMLFLTGKRLVLLGKPLEAVIRELRGQSGAPTFAEYHAIWERSLTCQPQSKAVYAEHFARARSLHHIPLDAITPTTIRTLAADLSRTYAANTVSATVTLVKSVLSSAHEDGLCGAPPRRVTRTPAATPPRPTRALTRSEHTALIAAAPQRWRALVAVWPWVGWRRQEACGAQFADIESGRIRILRQVIGRIERPPKYGSVRWVEALPGVVSILGDGEGFIFPAADCGPLSASTLNKAMADLGVDCHIFRHTFGSWLLEAGCSVPYVAARMGHKDGGVTLLRTYAHEIEALDARSPRLLLEYARGEESGTGA